MIPPFLCNGKEKQKHNICLEFQILLVHVLRLRVTIRYAGNSIKQSKFKFLSFMKYLKLSQTHTEVLSEFHGKIFLVLLSTVVFAKNLLGAN